MTSPRISITAAPRKPISVDFVGVEYAVTPPKSTISLAIAEKAKSSGDDPAALMAEVYHWVDLAFGRKQATAVRKRLDNADDDLDIPHVMELMQKLAEAGTANPTS